MAVWRHSESTPLTGDLPVRQTSPEPSSSSRVVKKYAAYVTSLVALLVIGQVALTSSWTSRPQGQWETSAFHAGSAFPGAQDEIVDLFGKPSEYTSRLFSGYLHLHNGGDAFYFFAESQNPASPENDPVLLWLNGGPGASSLSGCFSENGPLLVNEDGQSLKVNPSAWNQRANFLCIESPVGVGFSFNTSGTYVSDDLSQAQDLYDALQSFFNKFPWLRANDFIISGESYGGIYVPTTARAIVEGNLKGDEPKINLKKFVVGNGVNEFMGLSTVLFAYTHGVLSTEQYRHIRSSCPDMREYEPSPMFTDLDPNSPCGEALVSVYLAMMTSDINMYNVYGRCEGKTEDELKQLVQELLAAPSKFPHPIGNPVGMCLDSSAMTTYFNLPRVRAAMHTSPEIDEWYPDALTTASVKIYGGFLGIPESKIAAARLLDYSGTLQQRVTPIWKFLLAHNVPGVIYHGDVDMVCDFLGGTWAVESLKLRRLSGREPWKLDDDGSLQTAGFAQRYEGITFVTVKGAGHLVPMWKPREAAKMLDLFVLN